MPIKVATATVPFHAGALRVFKSYALIGLNISIAKLASAKFNNWHTHGHFAVMHSL